MIDIPNAGLFDYQLDAIDKMHNGCILCGPVGSGKSRTGIGYYFLEQNGYFNPAVFLPEGARDLYIITTARKRDKCEWYSDLIPYQMNGEKVTDRDYTTVWGNRVVIDSWNNIKKYKSVYGAFFIFDEDRVTGSGVWAKTFLDLARKNRWIILSATPGDDWLQYWAVFVANGFYKNKTHFVTQHCIQNPHVSYFSVSKYLDEYTLLRHKAEILVEMDYESKNFKHEEVVLCDYDKKLYNDICKTRWNIYTDKPIINAGEFCYILRKVVNSDKSRLDALQELLLMHPKIIVFYNFTYELELLRDFCLSCSLTFSEWNGEKHEDIPTDDSWLYLVQFQAGSEGWNCLETDCLIFYSQNYSYKTTTQAAGRIDRNTSPFNELYYYKFRSNSPIDIRIQKAFEEKRDFNTMDRLDYFKFA